jgi:hypothetical protein
VCCTATGLVPTRTAENGTVWPAGRTRDIESTRATPDVRQLNVNENAAIRGQRRSSRSIRPTHVGIIQSVPEKVLALPHPAPRTWGSSVRRRARQSVHRHPPHVRGDHPMIDGMPTAGRASAPRRWGSSWDYGAGPGRYSIRPTHVGIIRSSSRLPRPSANPPHARGDHPTRHAEIHPVDASSPRTWGSSPQRTHRTRRRVHPPHVRGDQSQRRRDRAKSAPRTWGSSRLDGSYAVGKLIRPTQVGIIPTNRRRSWRSVNPPHASGDHPMADVAACVDFFQAPRQVGIIP